MNIKKLLDLLKSNKRLLLDIADQLPALVITEYHRGLVFNKDNATIDALINQQEYCLILLSIVRDIPNSDNKLNMIKQLKRVEDHIRSFSWK